jgi:protocatechuate 3,4-dioxygenase beta subunit
MRKLVFLALSVLLLLGLASAAGSLDASIQDSDGNPLSNVKLDISGSTDTTAYTDSSGSTTVSRLNRGEHTVTASKSGYQDASSDFSIDYSGDKESVDLTLNEDIVERGQATVTITDQNGNPIEGAEITVQGPSETKAYTDSSGETTISRLKTGSYDIEASKDGSNSDTQSFSIDYDGDTESVDLSIDVEEETEQKASLEISIEDNEGKNMEDAQVTLSDGANRGPKYTDSYGDAVFNNLPASRDIDVQVKCYGETENKYNIQIDEGEHKSIDVYFDESFESSVCGEDTDIGPTASFSISDRTPEVGQWVTFDASSSEGNIKDYRWDFGDSDTYTDDDPKVSHRYNSKGDYTVELTVEEYDGDEDTRIRTLEVGERPNNAPEVSLNRPSDDQKINLPYSFRWDASDPDGDDIESTVFIAEDRSDESTLDDEYIIRENVGGRERFRLYESDLEEGEYMWGVKVTDDRGVAWSNVREFEVVSDRDKTGNADLKVFVENGDGDPIKDTRVVVDNDNWFSTLTDRSGEASFVVQSGTMDVTVSKDGYEAKTKSASISAGEDKYLSFTLREESRSDRDEQARLDVHVEDDDYDELEDAKITVEDGDREIEYTDSSGDARFYLEPDNYDIEVECNEEEESRNVYLSEGETETIDIRFDEDFDSNICEDDDRDIDDEEGLAIADVSYPGSVCRGGSFSADMRIENHGGFHELVTITGSGLGSINTGQSFSLDVAETKSASIQFTDVEGSGSEEFTITATNHDSDQTTQTIEVRDCGVLPDREGETTGVTAEVSPTKTVVGKAVRVKGYVDGVRGRSQVTIEANGERKARVSTEPDGFYTAYVRVNEIGDNIIRVSSGQSETSAVVEAVPISAVSGISATETVFEDENFEVCSNVNSQIEPKVFLVKNNEVIDSKFGEGEVCFERTASDLGEHTYQVKALTYGKQASSPKTTVNVLELGNEVTNFPDQVATTKSEEGMVKVELYNTHNQTRDYKVKLNGIRTRWLSQSQEDLILTKGERETVYFYLTPEEEGTFEPTITVVSEDTTIYSEEVEVYAGGTKTPKRTSFLGRLANIFQF